MHWIRRHFVVAGGVMAFSCVVQATSPTINLSVKGSLEAPQCRVQIPNAGVYDLGKLSPAGLLRGEAAGSVTQTWHIQCDEPVFLSMTPYDNRRSQTNSPSQEHFALWAADEIGEIGYYKLQMTNVVIDGAVATFFSQNTTSERMSSGRKMMWSQKEDKPKSGKTFMTDIMIVPSFQDAGLSKMQALGPLRFEGSTTIDFSYGI